MKTPETVAKGLQFANPGKTASLGKDDKDSAEKKDSMDGIEDQDSPNFDYIQWSIESLEGLSDEEVDGLKANARNGNLKACYDYGLILQHGLYDKQPNPEAAFSWFEKAAKEGHNYAQLSCAICYFYGIGIRKDSDQAIKILQALAAKEDNVNVIAQTALGDHLVELQRPADAFMAYSKAAKQGSALAKYRLANMYLIEQGRLRNYDEGLRLLKELSDAVPECQYSLATMAAAKANRDLYLIYRDGKYSEAQDLKQALVYLNRSAADDDPECMYLLGLHYANSKGADKDETIAFKLMKKASDRGMSDASYWFYEYYLNRKQEERAKDYLLRAAEEGHELAIMKCAECAYYGIFGFNQDIKAYEDWLLKGVNRGYATALHQYGMLNLGRGFADEEMKERQQNELLAFQSFVSAAKKEYKLSWFKLALIFYHKDSSTIFKDQKMCFSLLFHFVKAKNISDNYKGHAYYLLGMAFEQGLGVLLSVETAHSMYYKARSLRYPRATEKYDSTLHKKDADACLENFAPPLSLEACFASLDNDLYTLKNSQSPDPQKEQRQIETKESTKHLNQIIRQQSDQIAMLRAEKKRLQSERAKGAETIEKLERNVAAQGAKLESDLKQVKEYSSRKRPFDRMSQSSSEAPSSSQDSGPNLSSAPGMPAPVVVLSAAASAAANTGGGGAGRSAASSSVAYRQTTTNGSATTSAKGSSEAAFATPAEQGEPDKRSAKRQRIKKKS